MRSAFRIAWTVVTLVSVEVVVCAISVAPVVTVSRLVLELAPAAASWRVALIAVGAVPAYAAFALALLIVTPLAVSVTGWRTPPSAEMPLRDLSWPLLCWVRYLAVIHVARVFAGTLLRGTPLWTLHLRLCGARLGRRVYINSLAVSDYNLLEFEDDVVIGGGVHLSGHTVEHGVVKTGHVRLGRGVTVGLASIVEIDVEIAAGCQIGAMSFVPKHARLTEPGVYVGVPVELLRRHGTRAETAPQA